MQLTDRQVAITLAALRNMQRQVEDSPMFTASHLDDDPVVTTEEIDLICEVINFEDTVDG